MEFVIAGRKSVTTATVQVLYAAPIRRDGYYECGQLLVT